LQSIIGRRLEDLFYLGSNNPLIINFTTRRTFFPEV
jgi:hypothetical protein